MTTHDDIESLIVMLACFCAYGRCPVERDYRTRQILYQPEPEGPARLAKQFVQLGMGLALVHGKTCIDEKIYETLKKVGRDLITRQRLKILRTLCEQKTFEYLRSWLKTKEIANLVDMPAVTAKIVLEDLMAVGMLRQDLDGEGETAAWKWQLSQKGSDLIAGSEVFDVVKNEQLHT